MQQRADNRVCDEIRDIDIQYDQLSNALASVLFSLGNTKVLSAVTVSSGVPHFLRGKQTGWLTAQYSMLPTSTITRIEREINQGKRNGRFTEISRIIGRSLRAIVDLSAIGEQTIVVDCDVLQADGGTRTACITAAGLVLQRAEQKLLETGIIKKSLLTDEIAAISVGVQKNILVMDPNFEEDSRLDADFNVVLTRSGNIIEFQGTSERGVLDKHIFDQIYLFANKGIQSIFNSIELKKTNKLHITSEKEIVQS